MSKRKISPERQGTYYVGMVLTGLGLILFMSTFVSHCSHFGDFTDFENRSKTTFGTAIAGMICIGIGQFLMQLGREGVAGTGLKLDPEKAREDLEPWSRMKGGMLKDTLDEAGVDFSRPGGNPGELPFDEQLRRLDALQKDGLISKVEFDAARQKILNSLGQ